MEFASHLNYFAQTDFRGKKVPFGIKSDDRSRHMYIIGKTGMGKSTMLENLAIQDIKNGEGICFMDPHGSVVEKLLDFIPPHRVRDVIYLAPFDLDYPIAFNVMEDVGKDERHLVASGLMSTFEKIWVDAWSARMAYILNNTILALLEYPGSTLLGINRMLSDKKFREKVVNNISDPSVKSFWVDEFAKYTERFAAEATPAIQNKVGQFTSNPLIRNIIGQPKSSFDFRQAMDNKKIILINLSKGRIGEQNANLLGGMLITKIYLAAMSRSNMSPADLRQVPPFYLYVDEFQSFANKTFENILSESRKYKLSLTIAHQYIEQMEEEVRNSVFGNVGTLVSFRVGPFDAEVLEKVFFPTFTKEDLVNLGFTQIYLTLMIDGVGSPPFSATTLPPIVSMEASQRDKVIAYTREHYAKPRSEVEKDIFAWHEIQPSGAPVVTPATPAKQPLPEVKNPTPTPKPAPKPMPKPVEVAKPNKTVSLKELAPEKKAGSDKYKEDLKAALAAVINAKPKEEIKAPEPKVPEQKAPEPKVVVKEPATKEIPEDVLKKMLEV